MPIVEEHMSFMIASCFKVYGTKTEWPLLKIADCVITA